MTSNRSHYDVIILGAGGAGMMCAIQAGRRGRRVLLLDHSSRLGGKILISGGGRCNFTNLGASPKNYVSRNPHFCKSALSRYPSETFIELVREHGIAFHEKKLGQLFCDVSAQEIVTMLKTECERAEAEFQLGAKVEGVTKTDSGYTVATGGTPYTCTSLVIATGGLSIPKLGATGLGYDIAKQFGLKLTPRVPALDGFTFADEETRRFISLSGVSIDCTITCPKADGISFRENILFTHSGLSGPAALQASLHWTVGEEIVINLLPDTDALEWFLAKKREGSRTLVKNLLCELLPSRFATLFCELYFPSELPLSQISGKALEDLCKKLHAWVLIPKTTVGYNKAEVTRGGVDTDELSSKTMEARKAPGLYFIGEVVDVTGWLGGYNFQWAWASGWAAGQVV
ncbi:MAG: NAD(P)/FAD-dependent oxidoreductase [Bdellovibrionota bacterium]